jgi:hypothetical protein
MNQIAAGIVTVNETAGSVLALVKNCAPKSIEDTITNAEASRNIR